MAVRAIRITVGSRPDAGRRDGLAAAAESPREVVVVGDPTVFKRVRAGTTIRLSRTSDKGGET